jgi:hypothetical protein
MPFIDGDTSQNNENKIRAKAITREYWFTGTAIRLKWRKAPDQILDIRAGIE